MPNEVHAPGGNQDEEYKRGYELALAYAWHRFNSYDRQSGLLKKRYARIRFYIILASLLTTILSVVSVVERSERYWQLGFLLIGMLLFILSLRMVTSYQNTSWYTNWSLARWQELRGLFRRGDAAAQVITPPPAPETEEEKSASKQRARRQQTLRNGLLLLIAVIFFVLAASFWVFSNGAAEIVAYVGEGTILPPVRLVLIMLLITLPLVSSGLLDFAARFESRRNWVGFRLGAEKIRRAIYILRVRNYYEELSAEDLKALNDIVKRTRTALGDMGITAPLLSNNFDPEAGPVAPNYTYVPQDNGYSEMSVDDYFAMRLTPQLNWYRGRIRRDYARTRYYRGFILLFGGLGALLTALDLSEFAAITAACVTAIVTWLALMAHEQNYRVYASTLSRLEEEAADYKVRENIVTATEQIQFVWNVEKVLADELENWSQGVLQAQDVIEDNLGKMTKKESGEAQFDPSQPLRLENDRMLDVQGEVLPTPAAEASLTALPGDAQDAAYGSGEPAEGAEVTPEPEPEPEPGG